MESFKIRWKPSTKKDLRGIPADDVARILADVEKLEGNPFPSGSQKLSGSEQTYRIRIGDYRVIYEVFSKIVEVQRVRHRKDVYR